jgi:hypothetical protein
MRPEGSEKGHAAPERANAKLRLRSGADGTMWLIYNSQ